MSATWWNFLAFVAIMAIVAHSAIGLVAIWAGLGKPHWFLRVAVVGGLLTLGLPIPAYDLVVIFLAQSAVTILPLMVLRHLRARPIDRGSGSSAAPTARRKGQFSLLDLLLVTVVVSCLVAFAVHVPIDAWPVWWFNFGRFLPVSTPAPAWTIIGLIGVCFGISTLAAAWIALGTGRWWLRLTVLVLLPVSAIMAAWLALFRASRSRATGALQNGPISTQATSAGPRRSLIPRLARVAVVLLSLVILLPLAAIYYVLITPPPLPPEVAMPEENGYYALFEAGQHFERVQSPYLADDRTEADFRAFVARHRPVLDKAHAALDLECQVPVNYARFTSPSPSGFWELVRAFLAEAKVAEMDGCTSEAADCYLAIVRLSQAISRGGLGGELLFSRWAEEVGFRGMTDLRKMLPPQRCRELADVLRSLDAEREPVEAIVRRIDACEMHAGGWPSRLFQMLDGDWASTLPIHDKVNRAWQRLLICDLAIRCYQSDHGKFPRELSDLVPEYLPAVPDDPFSGKRLVYRPAATDYQLYSVGCDGNDDGGVAAVECWRGERGDLPLDALAKEPR